jgi:hypothetical protein
MSISLNVHAQGLEVDTTIRKVWDYELHADPRTAYSLRLTTTQGDEVIFFLSLNQIESIGEAIDSYVAKAIDVPAPTINDIKRMIEENEGISLS